MTRPFFSICIAAYNAERYIEDTLRSLSVQTCNDYEVVVVDDGSEIPIPIGDELVSILPSVILSRTENNGPYLARQKAFDLASGEVILCVDADDKLLDPDALSVLKRIFDEEAADVAFFNATDSEEKPSRLFDFSPLGNGGQVDVGAVWRLYTTSYSLNSLCCKAFRKTLYSTSSNKQRPRLLMAEDRLQTLEIMRNAGSFWLVDEPLYYYRPNPGSTTRSAYSPDYYRQSCYVEEEVLAYMNERGMDLTGWARYYLELTSRSVLGVFYNPMLGADERRGIYQLILEERVFKVAFGYLECAKLSKIDSMRLSLLHNRQFVALEVGMLPWKAGSALKHLPDRIRSMR